MDNNPPRPSETLPRPKELTDKSSTRGARAGKSARRKREAWQRWVFAQEENSGRLTDPDSVPFLTDPPSRSFVCLKLSLGPRVRRLILRWYQTRKRLRLHRLHRLARLRYHPSLRFVLHLRRLPGLYPLRRHLRKHPGLYRLRRHLRKHPGLYITIWLKHEKASVSVSLALRVWGSEVPFPSFRDLSYSTILRLLVGVRITVLCDVEGLQWDFEWL